MICATCGRDNPSHLVFCQECGQKLAPRIAPPTPPVGIVPPAALRGIGANGPRHEREAANPFGATAASPASPYSALATTASPSGGIAGAMSPNNPHGTPLGGAAALDATAVIPQAPAGRPSAPDFSFVPRGAPAAPVPPPPSVHMQSTPASNLPTSNQPTPKVSCPRCQASNDVGMRFCVACGGAMDARSPQPPQPAPSAPASVPITTRAPLSAPAPSTESAPAISPARVVSVAAAPPTETIRVCARCRGACDATAQFCRFCGASLGDSPAIPSAAFPSNAFPSNANHASGMRPATTASAAASASLDATPVVSKTDPIPPPVSLGAPARAPESMASAALSSLAQATRDSSFDAASPYTERDVAHDREPETRDAAVLLHPRPSRPDDNAPNAPNAPNAMMTAAAASAATTSSLEGARAIALRETSMLHGAIGPHGERSTSGELLPRARLVVIAKDGGEGASYPIGESMDIGRAEGHITIPEDPYLSPRHARIVRRAADGRLVLRDLGSTNGIYLRLRASKSAPAGGAAGQAGQAVQGGQGAGSHVGQRMTSSGPAPMASGLSGPSPTRDLLANASSARASRPPDLMNGPDLNRNGSTPLIEGGRVMEGTHRLVDQDLFLVGQQVLRFEVVSDARGEDGLGSASEHGTLLFGTPAAPRYARLSQRTVEGVSRDVFYVRKAETVLGRESGDIVFTEDPFLSRRHAMIRMDGDAGHSAEMGSDARFLLVDLGSSNGTFIQLRGEVPLHTGDQFRIGQQLFRIDIA